jgi:hypothetical protein
MEMTPNVTEITQALDRTARREKLLDEARGTWRLGWNDVWFVLMSGLLLYSYFRNNDRVSLAAFAGLFLVWRDKRLESRIDAIVRLLDREA